MTTRDQGTREAGGRRQGLARIGRFLRDIERRRALRLSSARLVTLEDHQLRDIGLSRDEANLLARNPGALPDRLRRH